MKSNGDTLTVWEISDPVMVMKHTPRNMLPAGFDEIMDADKARDMIRELMESGRGKRVK